VTDHAAGLTCYSLMSLFPALLLVVAVLGLVGQQGLITNAAHYLNRVGAPPSPPRSTARRARSPRWAAR
jgi:uncharacterized BrkB/YihY/UPF0761 family membrane protein